MGEMEQMENIYRAFLYCSYKVIQFSMSLQLSRITLWIQIVFAWKKFFNKQFTFVFTDRQILASACLS